MWWHGKSVLDNRKKRWRVRWWDCDTNLSGQFSVWATELRLRRMITAQCKNSKTLCFTYRELT